MTGRREFIRGLIASPFAAKTIIDPAPPANQPSDRLDRLRSAALAMETGQLSVGDVRRQWGINDYDTTAGTPTAPRHDQIIDLKTGGLKRTDIPTHKPNDPPDGPTGDDRADSWWNDQQGRDW